MHTARDPAMELEGHVMQVTHHQTYFTTLKKCGTGLVTDKSTGTGPEPVPAQIPPEPVLDRNSGWVLERSNFQKNSTTASHFT